MDGSARHTEQATEQDPHLPPGKYLLIFGDSLDHLQFAGLLHHGLVLHQLLTDHHRVRERVRQHQRRENILYHYHVHWRWSFLKFFLNPHWTFPALMHATIFGNVATIISRMYSKRQEYDKKILDLEHFVSVHKLPEHLKQR